MPNERNRVYDAYLKSCTFDSFNSIMSTNYTIKIFSTANDIAEEYLHHSVPTLQSKFNKTIKQKPNVPL